ncbi:uncharacterized protein EV422DRAFT_513963 [Fimicolochytrium jonesii]|uniref:uncharacterized protein n=1 Tax=Fimicolochytrium jonesii TaxID=1396493 RepID=UPI0022FE6FF1|nr:uncharacterized protein EV422DRAFT_513963 [Fimicolochytrium jonesii]KAI8825719.1 hypothetical protein EV422DRAFT_513963 [Fimicolochytrium jonesii]
MASSDDDADDWRDLVHYQGIEDLPKGAQSGAFIQSQRGQIQTTLRAAIDDLHSHFPSDLPSVKPIRDPDAMGPLVSDLIHAFPDSLIPSIRVPAGIAEFWLLTGETEPTSTASFGLPTIPADADLLHPKVPGLARISLDYDEEVDGPYAEKVGFWVACIAPLSDGSVRKRRKSSQAETEFGKIYFGDVSGKEGIKPVAESFEEFVSLWTEFMVECEWNEAATDADRHDLLGEFYGSFNED